MSAVHPSFDFVAKADENDVEAGIKKLVPRFYHVTPEYPKEEADKERNCLRMVDFEGAYNYHNSAFA